MITYLNKSFYIVKYVPKNMEYFIGTYIVEI